MITERLLALLTLPAGEDREQLAFALTSNLLIDSTGAKLTGQARITIDRINHYRDTVRAYQVKIDGQVAGRVKDGKQETFEISPGTHQVRVRLMWLQSPTVEVHLEEGTEATLRTGPNGGLLQAWRIYFAPHTAMFLEERSS